MRDEFAGFARGECAHVNTDDFEDVMHREPVSFEAWSEDNLKDLKEQKRRATEAAAAASAAAAAAPPAKTV